MMVLVTIMAAALLAIHSVSAEGVHLVVRATAWTSFAFFLLAFTAASNCVLLSNGFARWQRGNRRYLGLSFAYSHLIHAIAILAYVRFAPELFWQDRTPIGNIPGLVGYVFIALMAFTSFDRTAKLVGPRRWRLIHVLGVWIIWVDFTLAFGKRIPQGPAYAVATAIAVAALALRIAAIRRRRNQA